MNKKSFKKNEILKVRVVKNKLCGDGVITPGGVLHPIIVSIIDVFSITIIVHSLITWPKKGESCNLNKHLKVTWRGPQFCSLIGIHCVANTTSTNTDDIILSPSSSLLMTTYFVRPLNFSECLNSKLRDLTRRSK